MTFLETKNYYQKLLVNQFLGGKSMNYFRWMKMIIFFKLGKEYDCDSLLPSIIKKGDVVFDIGANIGQSIVDPKNWTMC